MIIQKENCKQLIDFLIDRWLAIASLAAMERVYIAVCEYSKMNNLPIPAQSIVTMAKPCLQIEIIKRRIIEILPEAHFINYKFEAQAPLNPNDFVEIYIAEQSQCTSKIQQLMQRLKIT